MQLYDPSIQVSLVASDILDEACDHQVTLSLSTKFPCLEPILFSHIWKPWWRYVQHFCNWETEGAF